MLDSVTAAVADGHDAVSTALAARLVNVKAARVIVDRGLNTVLSNVIRVNDPALLADLSSYIATELQTSEGKQSTSLGAFLELLPLIDTLIQAPYEEYLVAALNIIDAMVDAWKADFKQAARQSNVVDPSNMASVNLHSVFLKLVQVQTAVEKLTKRPDARNVHPIAITLNKKLNQLF